MFKRTGLLIAAGMCLLLFPGCQNEVNDLSSSATTFPNLDNGADGKADSASMTQEKRDILLTMKARYPDQRKYKELGVIGESRGGLVQVPDVDSVVQLHESQELELQERVANFVELENMDRNAYYDLLMMEHESEVHAQVEAKKPEIREQVVAQLCDELPIGVVCETLTDAVIGVALDEALEVSVQEILIEVREELVAVHADFWQSRTCRKGEWIEVADEDGNFWRTK